ncbi:MAG TPA: nucleoside triphosphate pyrophosphohydrolase [Candidatus Nanoarchaeia archaeon]|nr:nucleoside triphosphate pyrophosphohydrolase [Candidatus Nanoarchaeia archaeon]
MKKYNKLVRDKIPEIIRADGENPRIRILGDEEYKIELLKKIVEEAKEAAESGSDRKELSKEIGDVEEVIEAVIKSFSLDKKEIRNLKAKRKASRGGFEKKIFLEYTE